jgi:hypothetical protein
MPFIPRVVFSGLFGLAGFFTLVNIVEFLLPLKSRGRFLYKISNGLAFSEGKDIKICEDMAEQGYVLVSIGRWGFYKLERAESQKLSYAIDYSDISPRCEGFGEYIELFESGGWEYVFSHDVIHWFKSPKGTTPIYTDNTNLAHKYEKMRRISVWSVVWYSLAAAVFFLAAIFLVTPAFPVWFGLLMILGGAGFGIALAMSFGIILNHRRVVRLRKNSSS